MGRVSPVKLASFMLSSPEMTRQSQGNFMLFSTIIMSPGNNPELGIVYAY